MARSARSRSSKPAPVEEARPQSASGKSSAAKRDEAHEKPLRAKKGAVAAARESAPDGDRGASIDVPTASPPDVAPAAESTSAVTEDLRGLEAALLATERSLAAREEALALAERELESREALLRGAEAELTARESLLDEAGEGLALIEVAESSVAEALLAREAAVEAAVQQVESQRQALEAVREALIQRELPLQVRESAIEEAERAIRATTFSLLERERDMAVREQTVAEREVALAVRELRVAEREALLATREERAAAREHAALALEREMSARRDNSAARERELQARARALDARDEELTIREAAADEAMSLASETIDLPAAHLEGPDMVREVRSATDLELETMRQAEEVRKAAEGQRAAEEAQRAADERRRTLEEAEQLLLLLRAIPSLAPLEPRVQKAMAGSLNFTVLTAFYNMAVRHLAEQLRSGGSPERVAELEEALAEKQKALDDANGLNQSLKEDFNRYRTRTQTEQEAFKARANEALLHNIVPVADNFDRAFAAAAGATNVEAVINGVRMIHRQFEDVMAKEGLVPIKAAGLPFDPRVHEAVETVPTTDVADGMVYEEVQRGYYLGGKLFRPARVTVARAPAGAAPAPPES